MSGGSACRGGGWFGGKAVTAPAAPQAFTEQTLRTLCVAYKEVEESVYQQWQLRLEAASVQLQDRAQALQQVYSDMEQGLQVGDAWGTGSPQGQGPRSSAQFLPLLHTPTPSCWESQPSRTSSRTGSPTPSVVSRRRTLKCGCSRETSKVRHLPPGPLGRLRLEALQLEPRLGN